MCYYKGSVFFANEQNAAPENRRKSRCGMVVVIV